MVMPKEKVSSKRGCHEQCVILRLTARVIFSGYTSCPIVSTVSTKMLMCSFQTYINIDEFTMNITFIHASITYTIHNYTYIFPIWRFQIQQFCSCSSFCHLWSMGSLMPLCPHSLFQYFEPSVLGTFLYDIMLQSPPCSILSHWCLILYQKLAIFYPLCVHSTISGFQYSE